MQMVIDISDEQYELVQHGNKSYTTELELMNAVAKGTPLPKGHGRLIDADELKKHKYHDYNRFENAVAVAQIDWADTIIEADKGVNADEESD